MALEQELKITTNQKLTSLKSKPRAESDFMATNEQILKFVRQEK